ncbi:Aldehyde dehydrogenase domain containing protein [Tylopilus felleus]
MKIVQEEIFGPVGVVIKFKDADDVIRQANDTQAVRSRCGCVHANPEPGAHRLKAGTAWINCVNQLNSAVVFGGFKQSGIGRELGERCTTSSYTSVKAVHINLGIKL